MFANLFGDFVKGRDLSAYPPSIQKGIVLHRTIDDYIDHHREVVQLLHQLYPHLPKIAGIAVDLFFDHLLARNWSDYHPLKLEEFTQQFYDAPFNPSNYNHPGFHRMIKHMRAGNWLNHYDSTYGLTRTCEGVASRISFPNNLHKGPQIFLQFEKEITDSFRLFMADAIPFFQRYFQERSPRI